MPDAASVARGVEKPRRPPGVAAQVSQKFLAGGVLDHGFARVRCDYCAHEYLLAPVPHRQVVFTIPKRLRAPALRPL